MYQNRYRCDQCGCYLDPGEGNMCEECQRELNQRVGRAKRIKETVKLGINDQYELNTEVFG